jgi:hypothetical protein
MIALSLFGIPNRTLLVAVTAGVLISGLWCFVRSDLKIFANFLTSISPFQKDNRTSCFLVVATLTVLLLLFIDALYAGHPRRLYDQLNYHLVLGRIFLILREPIVTSLDSHVFFCGPVEYAFMWVSALFPDDFFLISVGQMLIFLSSVGTLSAALFMILKTAFHHSAAGQLAIVVLALISSLIPNDELIRIAKPDALTLSGTVLLFGCYFRKDLRQFWLLTAIACVVLSVKITFAHALVAFAFPFLRLNPFSGESFKRWSPLLMIGMFVIGLNVLKSLMLTGSPFYPMDSRWFDTDFSGEITRTYWREVAFTEHPEHFTAGWLGLFKLVKQSLGLTILIPVLAMICFVLRKKGDLSTRPVPMGSVLLFLAIYSLLWPLFFRSDIYSRFVAPATGGCIVLCVAMLSYLPNVLFRRLTGFLIVLMLATSNLEVKANQMFRWNQGSTRDAMASQFPILEAAEIVNQTNPRYDDLILVDDPAVYFYNVRTLFNQLTPREAAVWQDFQEDPQQAAREHRLRAMVRSKTFVEQRRDGLYKYQGPFIEVWNRLSHEGRVVETSDHQILLFENW